MERLYLDMCSLKRPFDDQRQPRVREEAAAVAAILARAEAGEIALVRSPAHLVENDANPREDRRIAASLWIDGAAVDARMLSNYEIRAEGWKALTERLGLSGAIRFLMEYDPGRGDYVEERRELFRELTLDEAIARARAKSGGSTSQG